MLRPALALAALVALLGCSSTPPAPAAPTETAQPAAATPSATAAAAPAAAPKINPKTVDDCKAIAASSTEDDPAAGAPQATGTSDRSAAITAIMKQKRPGFRCCFDIWADKIPEAKLYTKVALALEIGPKGDLKKAAATPEEAGSLVSSDVAGCLGDVAGSLAYPPATNGKETKYTWHFDFKPKGRR